MGQYSWYFLRPLEYLGLLAWRPLLVEHYPLWSQRRMNKAAREEPPDETLCATATRSAPLKKDSSCDEANLLKGAGDWL